MYSNGHRHRLSGCFCKADIGIASDYCHLTKLCFVLSSTGGGLRYFFWSHWFLAVCSWKDDGECAISELRNQCNMLSVFYSGGMQVSCSTGNVVAFDLQLLT